MHKQTHTLGRTISCPQILAYLIAFQRTVTWVNGGCDGPEGLLGTDHVVGQAPRRSLSLDNDTVIRLNLRCQECVRTQNNASLCVRIYFYDALQHLFDNSSRL